MRSSWPLSPWMVSSPPLPSAWSSSAPPRMVVVAAVALQPVGAGTAEEVVGAAVADGVSVGQSAIGAVAERLVGAALTVQVVVVGAAEDGSRCRCRRGSGRCRRRPRAGRRRLAVR